MSYLDIDTECGPRVLSQGNVLSLGRAPGQGGVVWDDEDISAVVVRIHVADDHYLVARSSRSRFEPYVIDLSSGARYGLTDSLPRAFTLPAAEVGIKTDASRIHFVRVRAHLVPLAVDEPSNTPDGAYSLDLNLLRELVLVLMTRDRLRFGVGDALRFSEVAALMGRSTASVRDLYREGSNKVTHWMAMEGVPVPSATLNEGADQRNAVIGWLVESSGCLSPRLYDEAVNRASGTFVSHTAAT